MKILIVDDDELRAAVLAKYLCKELPVDPAQIEVVHSASAARSRLRAQHFEALVLDVVIPNRNKERPSEANGMALLDQVFRAAFLKKPDRIIGITAHAEDLGRFRQQFEMLCSVVIEASQPSDHWRRQIANALSYSEAARLSRQLASKPIAIISVHGIRTYGTWQARLRELIQARAAGCEFYNYKYGHYSTLALLFPPARRREIQTLVLAVKPLLSKLSGRRVFVFAHSFGTYLVAHALKELQAVIDDETEVTVVLCGSVLSADFDWSFVCSTENVRVVNDCGDKDYVLWLSHAAALGLGMAGKTGFRGFNGSQVTNRYFNLSHSGYFTDREFMPKYWLPLLSGHEWAGEDLDYRTDRGLIHNATEALVRLAGRWKWAVYSLAIPAGLVGLIVCLFRPVSG